MRGLTQRTFLLFAVLIFLSIHTSHGLTTKNQGEAVLSFGKGIIESISGFIGDDTVVSGSRENRQKGAERKSTDEILQFVAGGHVLGFKKGEMYIASRDHALRIEFVNAYPVSPLSDTTSPTVEDVNLIGEPLGEVSYSELWDGVTLVYERNREGVIKSTYTVQPERMDNTGSVDKIRLRYNVPVNVNNRGNLVFSFETGQMIESKPIAWQVVEGIQKPVEISFRSLNEREVGFEIESYNPNLPLVIDPVMSWNTFLGSPSSDQGLSIAVDTSGNIYVSGFAYETWGSPVNPFAGYGDAFVAKLNADGIIQWHTFFGSNIITDYARAITVDASGNIYATGSSGGTWGMPVNPHSGDWDAFVVKLNNEGKLQWNTFLGSSGEDNGLGIALDGSGNIYVTGYSPESWATPVNAYTGGIDAFVAKLNSSGSLQWNTFLGSSGDDEGLGIAVDASGNLYLGGESSESWSTPVNAYTGGIDGFVAKLNSSGTLQWNTFLGSTSDDNSSGIVLDGSGNIFVSGSSVGSWGLPVNTPPGGNDAFVAKLNNSGILQWNTFLGSASDDRGSGIALDENGGIYVSGQSYATWGSPLYPYTGGWDVFAAKLNSSGSFEGNTFMGSSNDDYCYKHSRSIAVEGKVKIYVVGTSQSSWGTPVNPLNETWDAFAAKIADISEDDILGTWPSGVWYRHAETGLWAKLSSQASLVAAGDIDCDGIDDLIGVWGSGLWVKFSSSGSWAKLTSSLPDHIAAGDMNGDGCDDVLATWAASGVWYRDSASGTWIKLCSAANLIATGYIDADNISDLIGVWSSGLWVKYSNSGSWEKLTSSIPTDIATGDINGDGREDIVGSWTAGVWYRNTIFDFWTKMSASPASLIAVGEIDGDERDDLIGVWSSGLWVKYSLTMSWQKLTAALPNDIDTGIFRDGAWSSGAVFYDGPFGGYADEPGSSGYLDLSDESPGGRNPLCQEEGNLIPQEPASLGLHRTPGPGEPGFEYAEQENLVPREKEQRKKTEKS